ncbi:Dihydrolipoyl dehydrogenase 3 [Alphaproteobacteria bacterium SO-S41]|nr:Dihydrolipoyl dehydrogenase 3 [Alphaproteobacteria bacterium SO-S41]
MPGPYDVVVIGGGPGGYNAAIRAAQLGLKTACIEKRAVKDAVAFGGTCLNVGCIPSKALLFASERFEDASKHFASIGIKVTPEIDLPGMMGHKERTVDQLVKGVSFLFKKNKVDPYFGTGRIVSATQVELTGPDGTKETLETKNIIIATGSEVMPLPGVTVDEKVIVSSTGILSLSEVPKRLTVIGAGIIGLELGSVWRRLGAEVTVIEYLDRIVPGVDGDVAKEFQKILTRQGIKFKLATKVTKAEPGASGVTVTMEPAAGGAAETLETDILLVCIGRRPFIEGLGAKEAGVAIDKRGRVETDGHGRTNVPGIWVVGDVTTGPMLAHKAEDEAMAVAELIAGKAGHVNYDVIPSVVYTHPEVASVGKTEDELKAAGVAYKTGKFPFTANARAKTVAEKDGFVKIIADAKTDRVLGCHIIGPEAGNLIMEVAVAMEFGASSEDIARTCHPHPTLTEGVRQAALGVDNRIMQM